tara:strand:- start:150571 stop:151305 length:735 start_codon:yes stop_codon:yes gene_type:complete
LNPLKSVFLSTGDWADQENISHDSFETIGSTNDQSKTLSLDIDFYRSPKLILANHQTHGRGRSKNQWVSPAPNSALFCSWTFDLHKPPQPITPPLIGLSVFDSLKKVWPNVAFSIKAPNDIYIKNKKVAGILIESIQKGDHHRLVIGIGLNVLSAPKELTDSTCLLENLTEFLTVDLWNQFLDELYKNLRRYVKLSTDSELDTADRMMIKKALSACPYYSNEIMDISPKGDIIFEDKTIPWQDL